MVKNSINSIRGVIVYVRSSSERSKLFDDCVLKSKVSCKGSVSLDVPTRWNSTYIMLDTALKFEKAFKRMKQEDPQIEKDLKDKFPSQKDWDNATALSLCFKQFFDATKRMSGTLYVTANMHYHEILGVLASLLEWKQDMDPNIKLVTLLMLQLVENHNKYLLFEAVCCWTICCWAFTGLLLNVAGGLFAIRLSQICCWVDADLQNCC
ncbi:unnamed protein product [Lactuca virosa]|uniref:hAT-like transposase RNase-H fold domain-containing protein n=1 Tax=Lactuca virosa TaxID=75947 RepID=A0AAU9PNL3_9ASTR|nr:unnamed protein product [Lactuca virosa]